jgi:hypothetical protein
VTAQPEFKVVPIPQEQPRRRGGVLAAAVTLAVKNPGQAVYVRVDQTGCATPAILATSLAQSAHRMEQRISTRRDADGVFIWVPEVKQ